MITMNPDAGIAASVERVQPGRKPRCARARRDPRGSGVNAGLGAVDRLGSDGTALSAA